MLIRILPGCAEHNSVQLCTSLPSTIWSEHSSRHITRHKRSYSNHQPRIVASVASSLLLTAPRQFIFMSKERTNISQTPNMHTPTNRNSRRLTMHHTYWPNSRRSISVDYPSTPHRSIITIAPISWPRACTLTLYSQCVCLSATYKLSKGKPQAHTLIIYQ